MCVCIALAAGPSLQMLLHQAGEAWWWSTRQGRLLLVTCKEAPAEAPSRSQAPESCDQPALQVVVDSEQTAKALLSKGRLRNRVTIIPLNKVGPAHHPSASFCHFHTLHMPSQSSPKLA